MAGGGKVQKTNMKQDKLLLMRAKMDIKKQGRSINTTRLSASTMQIIQKIDNDVNELKEAATTKASDVISYFIMNKLSDDDIMTVISDCKQTE